MVPITWDVFIAIFIIIIVSYSFIIGRDGTLKVIIASYMGVLTANGIGNMLTPFILEANNPSLEFISTTPEENVVIFKILMYVITTLLIVLKGGFRVSLEPSQSIITSFVATAIYGVLSAGLIITTLLSFMTGSPLDGLLSGVTADIPISLENKTLIFKTLVENSDIWFVSPAVVFFFNSLFTRDEEGEQTIGQL